MNNQNTKIKVWVGLISIYVIWGSTYLATRYAVVEVPSLIISAFRNIFAGTILILIAIFTKNFKKPNRNFWISTIVSGFLLLSIGNGFFAISAKWLPSSFNSLIASLSPMLMVMLVLIVEKKKPNNYSVYGSIIGLVGVLFLVLNNNSTISGYENYYFIGVGFSFFAVLSWIVGVIYVKQRKINDYSSIQIAGFQMAIGGVINLLATSLLGDFDNIALNQITVTTIISFWYLILLGSVYGFSVFGWLSKNTSPTLVATYTFVNPVIAIILGNLIAKEPINSSMIIAIIIISIAVILITKGENQKN